MRHTTALPIAQHSAHIPTGKLAFSTLTPVMNLPAWVNRAAPTRKLEYGPERDVNSSSSLIINVH